MTLPNVTDETAVESIGADRQWPDTPVSALRHQPALVESKPRQVLDAFIACLSVVVAERPPQYTARPRT